MTKKEIFFKLLEYGLKPSEAINIIETYESDTPVGVNVDKPKQTKGGRNSKQSPPPKKTKKEKEKKSSNEEIDVLKELNKNANQILLELNDFEKQYNVMVDDFDSFMNKNNEKEKNFQETKQTEKNYEEPDDVDGIIQSDIEPDF